jgi:Ni,Fe-hydrogenase III small subunit
MFKSILHLCRKKSPWLFHMNSGSCNGCDIELVACLSPRYDVEQIGVHLEGSPRHADILCISGPVTHNTLNAVKTVYSQVPHPKAVVALGSCSASCNAFAGSPTIVGPLHKHIPVDVYVPGCPPRPDAVIEGIFRAAELLNVHDRKPLTDEEMGGAPDDETPAVEEVRCN